MSTCKNSGKRSWRYEIVLAGLMVTVTPAAATPIGEVATLERVVDGDTLWVRLNGTFQSIRYLGINAPELDTDCGKQATRVHRRLVKDKQLRLVPDTDVSNIDAYGRLLRYVYADGVLVNAALVQQGVAWARQYEPGIDLYPYFAHLQRVAQAAGRGCL
jgi:micrococcal nuclease